jgi:hypothetical protein
MAYPYIPNFTGAFLGHYLHDENMSMNDPVAGDLRIVDLAAPVGGTDAVNKDYVDGLVTDAGYIDVVDTAVRGVMEESTTDATRVGNVLTADVNGEFNSENDGNLDGITYIVSDRILLTAQTSEVDNGIYTITDLGSAGTPYILTRATDFDASDEVFNGRFINVSEGDLRTGTKWIVTSPPGFALNTDDLLIELLSGQVNVEAGTALTLTDRVFSVTADSIGTTELDSTVPLSFWAAATGSVDLGNQLLVNVATPVSSTDGVNKSYVDSVGTGITVKAASQYATIQDLDTTAGANPPVYVGSPTFTLTAGINQSIASIIDTDDGSAPTLTAGVTRLLVKDDSDGDDTVNGIYVVTTIGDGANPWVLTRATDFDADNEINVGSLTLVEFGDNHGNQQWVVTSPDPLPLTVDTDSIIWVLFSGSTTTIIAGDALAYDGTIFRQLDVQVDGTTIEVNADALRVVPGSIGTTELDNTVPVSYWAAATANVDMNQNDLVGVDRITLNEIVLGPNTESVTGDDVIVLPVGFTLHKITRTAGAGDAPTIQLPVPVDENIVIVQASSVATSTTFDLLPPAGGSIYGANGSTASRIEFTQRGQHVQLIGDGTDYLTLTTGATYIP